jgi:hypothetical protein
MAAAVGMSAVLLGYTAERTKSEREIVEPQVRPETTAPSTPEAALPTPPAIGVAPPRRLTIPALKFEGSIDGAIHPVPVPHRGDDVYYDPPTNDGIYWAEGCALPASPSEGTTYLFGHSDVAHIVGGAVFDRLPDLIQRDRIELTTTLGRFAFQVTKNLSIPYDELAHHTGAGDFGDGLVKDRLVLITCRVPDAKIGTADYNTVICADRIDALPL